MLFYFNTSGSVTTSIPSPIYQGSVGVNEILVLAPFVASTTVTASFLLPNGVKLYPRLAEGGELDTEAYLYRLAAVEGFSLGGMNLWCLTLDKALTQYAGDLSVQFSFTDISGRVLTSDTVSVTVSAGVPSLPVYPTQNDFEIITGYLSQALNAKLNAEAAATAAGDAKKAAEEAKTAAVEAKTIAENEARSASDYSLYASNYATAAENAKTAAENAADQAYLRADEVGHTVADANYLLAEVNALVGDLNSAFDELHTYASFKKGGGV